jgi:hypothetical protein
MTVAVNMSRDDQQSKQDSKHRPCWGKQAQWIRDVRSGPWPVTMLEVNERPTRCTIAFGWSNVEIMIRQVSD